MIDTSKATGVNDREESGDKVGYIIIAEVDDKTPELTAISETTADGASLPTVNGNRITVPGTTDFEVFNSSGAKVNANAPLSAGIYVVKVAGASYKVIVK